MTNSEIAISVSEACRRLGISKATFYRRAAKGGLTVRKLGSRSVICVADLLEWAAQLPSANEGREHD